MINKKIRLFLSRWEPYGLVFIAFICCVLGLVLIISVNIFDFFNSLNLTQRALLSSSISAIIAIGLIIVSFKAHKKMQYFQALKAVITEMKTNYDSIKDFKNDFKASYGDLDNFKITKWIGKKPSLTNWGNGQNFHLKFFPTQAYFDFVNKGYSNQNESLTFSTEAIAHFYQFCMEFNNDLQQLENAIQNFKQPVPIKLTRYSEKTFTSQQEICKFVIEDFFPYYTEKTEANRFNDGIKNEYRKTIKELQDHRYLIPKKYLSDLPPEKT